jgi:Dolichyl-phosphate-mannose-protein mannosyltransferase
MAADLTAVKEKLGRLPVEWWIALVVGLLHLIVASRYDFFRNELYFIVCGRHPDFGYVDQPPLVPLLAAATQIFGENIWLLRLPGVIAAAGLVLITAAFARLLGGNDRSAWLAGLSAGIAPALAALTSILTTSTLEPIAWTALAFLLVKGIFERNGSAMIWAGVIAGLSMEAKYGIAFWMIGLAVGLACTQARWVFVWQPFWLALLIGLALSAPSLVWQQVHNWPFREVHTNHLMTGANYTGTPLVFVSQQILGVNPLLAPLWIIGLVAPFVRPELRPARFLAIGFLVCTAMVFFSHGKDYYLFPVYPVLFAIGAAAGARLPRWGVVVWSGAATIAFALSAPVVLPILSPSSLAEYLAFTHLAPRPEEAAAVGAPLTQIFSDQLGWRELERQVAAVYQSLSAEERKRAALFAVNYGEAAALDFYGAADGLPPALCGQNQYFLWGTHGFDGDILVHINGDPERWRRAFGSVDVVAKFGAPFVMPYESDRPIFVARDLRVDFSRIWPRLKRYE